MTALDRKGKQILEGDEVVLRGKVLAIVSGGDIRVRWQGVGANYVDFIRPKVCEIVTEDSDSE